MFSTMGNPDTDEDFGDEDATFTEEEAALDREKARYGVDLAVTVNSEHNFYAGFIENMSVGGVFMATHLLKPLGEMMELTIYLPGREHPVRARGEVRWVREFNEASNVPPGMGIRFVEVDSDSVHAIDEFLGSREPMFFDDD